MPDMKSLTRTLSTIQKRNKLNYVHAIDELTNYANHEYCITRSDTGELITKIQFQKGPRNEKDSVHGVIDTDLLEIVKDRLQGFQSSEFATRENEFALHHIEEALMWMNRRVEDRAERNVLGTYNK